MWVSDLTRFLLETDNRKQSGSSALPGKRIVQIRENVRTPEFHFNLMNSAAC